MRTIKQVIKELRSIVDPDTGALIYANKSDKEIRFYAAASLYNEHKHTLVFMPQKGMDGAEYAEIDDGDDSHGFLKLVTSSDVVDRQNDVFPNHVVATAHYIANYKLAKGQNIWDLNHNGEGQASRIQVESAEHIIQTDKGEVCEWHVTLYLEDEDDREIARNGGFNGVSVAGSGLI